MFKKTHAVIVAAAIMFAVTACSGTGTLSSLLSAAGSVEEEGSATDGNSATEETINEAAETVEEPLPAVGTDEKPAVSENEGLPPEEKGTEIGDELYNADGLVIVYDGITEDSGYINVLVTISNQTRRPLTISALSGWTDDFMQECIMSQRVNDHVTAPAQIRIGKRILGYTGVRGFRELGINLHAIDGDTFSRFETRYPLVIRFPEAESLMPDEEGGSAVYEKGGISIMPKEVVPTGLGGYNILYYVKNDSDQNITVFADDFEVDGIALDMFPQIKVMAGKRAILAARIVTESVSKYGINAVGNVRCTFSISDTDTYDRIDKVENVLADFSTLSAEAEPQ